MNWQKFIAERIRGQKKRRFSAVVIPVAIGSIALGLAAAIISFSIFSGFKKHITDKLFAMSGHISIGKFDLNNSSESLPVSKESPIYKNEIQGVSVREKNIFVTKTALLKSEEEVAGVMMKGIDEKSKRVKDEMLKKGDFIRFTDSAASMEILLSEKLSDKLNVNIGDNLIVFFVQNPPRYRRMKVVGLFSSDIEEFDEHIVYTDYRVLQQINGWADSLVTGIEVSLNDFDRLDDEYSVLFDEMPYDMYAEKVTETHRHFFDWFVMLKRNVVIFLAVILFVACFNVISVLLIMVTERTEMIGILKSFGASNFAVQKIFFYNGIHLIIKGLLFGNAAALGFGYLQNTFKIIPLDPRNYYMESVPFRFDWGFILSANAAVALLSLVVLMIPVFFISRISPAKAIRFD